MVNLPINSQTITVIFSIAVSFLVGFAVFITTENKVGELDRRENARYIEQNKRIDAGDVRFEKMQSTLNANNEQNIRLGVLVQVLTEAVTGLRADIKELNDRQRQKK
ncbi:MAG: hypothetical protein ACKO96_04850 [Flammeovirgaceae bacterium]